MLYSIVLVSTKHQHESAIGLPMSPPTWTSLPPPSSHSLSKYNYFLIDINTQWLCLKVIQSGNIFKFCLISKMVNINSYNLYMKNLFDSFFRVHGGPENRKFENHWFGRKLHFPLKTKAHIHLTLLLIIKSQALVLIVTFNQSNFYFKEKTKRGVIETHISLTSSVAD